MDPVELQGVSQGGIVVLPVLQHINRLLGERIRGEAFELGELLRQGLELRAVDDLVVGDADVVGAVAVGAAAVGVAHRKLKFQVGLAGFLGYVGGKELDGPGAALGPGQQAGLAADLDVDKGFVARFDEIADLFLRHTLHKSRHDGLPHNDRGIQIDHQLDLFRLVVAAPDRGGVSGREAREPAVPVAGGGAGLSCHADAAEAGIGAGAVGAGIFQHIEHIPGGVGVHGLMGLLGVVDDDVALGVLHLGVGPGLAVDAAVGEGRVGCRHLPDGHAVGKLAHAQGGKIDIGITGTVFFLILDEARQTELFLGELIARLRRHVGEDLHGNGVQGLGHAVVDQHPAAVSAVLILRPVFAVKLHQGGILVGRAGGNDAQGQTRAVDRQRLDGGARRELASGGAVPGQVALLLADAAGHGDDVAGLVVDDDNSRLQMLIVFGNCLGHVIQVLIDLVHLGLGFNIQRGVDPEAAGGDHLAGCVKRNALQLRQVVDDVPDHRILKPGVVILLFHVKLVLLPADGAGVEVTVGRVLADGPLEIAFLAVVFLGSGRGALEFQLLIADGVIGVAVLDISLLEHLLEDGQGTVFVVLRVVIGVVARGVVGDSDDAGAFLGSKLVEVLAKVGVGGALDAVGTLAQVDGVQIPGDDLFLGIVLLEVESLENLHELATDRDVALIGQVFDELLGKSGTAVAGAADKHIGRGGQGAHPVHAVVLPEALVLDGNGRVDHVLGNILVVDPYTVFDGKQLSNFLELPGFRVLGKDERRLVELHTLQIVVGNRLDIIFNIVSSLLVHADRCHAPRDTQEEGHGKEGGHNTPQYVKHRAGNGTLARIGGFFAFDDFFLFHIQSSMRQCRVGEEAAWFRSGEWV